MPEKFDIWQAAVPLGMSDDRRPILIVDVFPDRVGYFPISGQCYSHDCFLIEESDDDFQSTGLAKSCYVLDERIIEADRDDLIRHRGQLVGELLDAFLNHSGLPPA